MHTGDSSARASGYILAAQKHADIQGTLEVLRAMSDALSRLLDSRADDVAHGQILFEESPLFAPVEGEPESLNRETRRNAENLCREGCYAAA